MNTPTCKVALSLDTLGRIKDDLWGLRKKQITELEAECIAFKSWMATGHMSNFNVTFDSPLQEGSLQDLTHTT